MPAWRDDERCCSPRDTQNLIERKNYPKEKSMEIRRVGSQPSGKGPSDWFTGTVRIDPLFTAPDPALVARASVTFEPGARTAWHTHPLGQTLIVTSGARCAQREGGPIEERSEEHTSELQSHVKLVCRLPLE